MSPRVLGVAEARRLDGAGRTTTVLVVTYNVGTLGPFTLDTTKEELASGAATAKMQQFATSLGNLPLDTAQ